MDPEKDTFLTTEEFASLETQPLSLEIGDNADLTLNPESSWQANRKNVDIKGIKHDSLGNIGFPFGNDEAFWDSSRLKDLIENVGYYTSGDESGTKMLVVSEIFEDRVTGEIQSKDIPIDVTVDWSSTFANAQYLGTYIPGNNKPFAMIDKVRANPGEETIIDVLANDTDYDGDALKIITVSDSSNASVSIQDSKILYTPNNGFDGMDILTYTIEDEKGATDTAKIEVITNFITESSNQVDLIEPGSPLDLNVSNLGLVSFDLNWGAAIDNIGVSHYLLTISENSDFSSALPGFNSVNIGDVNSLNVNSLSANTKYYISLKAVDTSNNVSSPALLTVKTRAAGELSTIIYPSEDTSSQGVKTGLEAKTSISRWNRFYAKFDFSELLGKQIVSANFNLSFGSPIKGARTILTHVHGDNNWTESPLQLPQRDPSIVIGEDAVSAGDQWFHVDVTSGLSEYLLANPVPEITLMNYLSNDGGGWNGIYSKDSAVNKPYLEVSYIDPAQLAVDEEELRRIQEEKDSSGDGANGSGDLVVPLGFELPTTIRDMKIINNESVEFTITLPLSVMQEIMEKARH
ncbi:MAG: cadherin-like domain-containing protein [Candidatus Caenarcaniphilales bacterium]|nr:cadherin-like domain-containing protein [Candidatus Caenarcaniphilales bacterium]